MKKNIILTIVFLTIILLVGLIKVDSVKAGCEGSYTSTGLYDCDYIDGWYRCNLEGTEYSECTWHYNYGACMVWTFEPDYCTDSQDSCMAHNQQTDPISAPCTFSCDWGNWYNIACEDPDSGCGCDEMFQAREAVGCDPEYRCVTDASCTCQDCGTCNTTHGACNCGGNQNDRTHNMTCDDPSCNTSWCEYDAACVCATVTADIKANSSDGPITVNVSESFSRSWSSTNADSCTIAGVNVGTSGSDTKTEYTAGTYDYTLNCSNTCGNSDNDTVRVIVKPYGTIQGRKGIVSMSSPFFIQVAPAIGQRVTLQSWPFPYSISNPFYFVGIILDGETYAVDVADIPGGLYETQYSLCYNEISCHGTYSPGNSVNISETSMDDGGGSPYADLYWHFIPLPYCMVYGDSTIIKGAGPQAYNVNGAIQKAAGVDVSNQTYIARTAASANPPKSIANPLDFADNNCGNNAICSVATNINADSMNIGDKFYVYCREWNDALHECFPFETLPAHPVDAWCGTAGGDPYKLVTVIEHPRWWQVKNADVFSKGDIDSEVVYGSYFDIHDVGQFPGVPFAASIGIDATYISDRKWNAIADYDGDVYDFSYFKSKAESEYANFTPLTGSINNSVLSTGGYRWPANGQYYWYKATGGTTITGSIGSGWSANRKVIIFVESGNISITGNVDINTGKQLFMVVAANVINLSAGVTQLDGIYVTDKTFQTGTLGLFPPIDSQLNVNGSVVGWNIGQGGAAIVLQRDLADNIDPAEIITYSPAQVMQIPPVFGKRDIIWKEVAP
ncbi:hypothetical protein A2W13_00055 [Candidatus Woesebacteria bacterium RBG_16_36_11]|uniref:PKD domain-containing protein n=1 Tax=Candidatus Woesebacteria bacterium RBG_16_36_11 TaxID=1802481 RepID=A0A1F7XAG1_9BACT|nr:MAG: hypothetical protein A2W13_00055 [Candidatus Woesebacteria bacterium RBG_16_36_11]